MTEDGSQKLHDPLTDLVAEVAYWIFGSANVKSSGNGGKMAIGVGTIDQLSQIISQVVGPSFLLGAVASFISMLFNRMQLVLDRIRMINAVPGRESPGMLREDLPRLKRRIGLLHRSIQLAIMSGIVTTVLIIMAFAVAFFHSSHLVGSALLFVISLSFFFASLVVLAREVSISVSEYDHH